MITFDTVMYLVPVLGFCALIFAGFQSGRVAGAEEGNEKMKEISGAISEGAHAFLLAEYRILIVFVALLFVLIGVGIGSWTTAVCFLAGALFSTLSGFYQWLGYKSMEDMLAAMKVVRKIGFLC